MAVSYSADLKSTRMKAVADRIDVNGNGVMEFCTAGYGNVLSSIILPLPSFIEGGGVITLQGVPLSDLSAGASGVASAARIKDGIGNVVVNGLTVGTNTGDVQLTSQNIQQNQTVTLISGTITHSP